MTSDLKNIFKPIEIIYSQNNTTKGIPIQYSTAKNISGIVEVCPEFVDGLKYFDGFFYIILLCYFHLCKEAKLVLKLFLDDEHHSVFATQAQSRHKPIGLSYVNVNKIV